jgi:hypothetical protein
MALITAKNQSKFSSQKGQNISEDHNDEKEIFNDGKKNNVDNEPDPVIDLAGIDVKLDENGLPILEFETNDNDFVEKIEQTKHKETIRKDNNIRKQNVIIEQNIKNPIQDLIEKAKKSETIINIELKENLISKNLFEVLVESYEGQEDKIVEEIFNTMNFDAIKETIKKQILNYFKS